MVKEINLVPEIAEAEIKKGVYKKKSNLAAVISLLFFGGLIALVFALQALLFIWGEKIERDTKGAEELILSQKEKDITRRALVDKLKKAESFLSTRIPYSAGLGELMAVFKDTNVILKDASFEEDNVVNISGQAANSADLDKLLNALVGGSAANAFGGLQLVTLSGNKDKPYTFTVDFRFPKPGWKPAEGGNSKKP